MKISEKSIFFAVIVFLIGYAYLHLNGTYWLNKKAEMLRFTNLYYLNETIFVENNEGKTINYQLKTIKNNQTILEEYFELKNKEVKKINFNLKDRDIRIYLIYENKSLEINPFG